MNRRTEKTVITVEAFQRTVVYSRRKTKIARCEQCAAKTVMLALNEAAAVLRIPAREIFRLAECGQMHSTETDEGLLMLCGNSLAALAKN